jgi:hypothetical protein
LPAWNCFQDGFKITGAVEQAHHHLEIDEVFRAA